MELITINDNHLCDENIKVFHNKVRAILLDDDKILISHYGGVILLPGGSIDEGEKVDDAIIRELEEETGIVYDKKMLNKMFLLKYYQDNYPTRDGRVINRLMTTEYYLGKYQGIDMNNVKRTEKEKNDKFYLQLMKIDELFDLLYKKSDNPRKKYFDREINEVVKVLKKIKN